MCLFKGVGIMNSYFKNNKVLPSGGEVGSQSGRAERNGEGGQNFIKERCKEYIALRMMREIRK